MTVAPQHKDASGQLNMEDKKDKTHHTAPLFKSEILSFMVCVVGIYISYLVFGMFQEGMNKETFGPEKKKFKNTAFLLFWQCFIDAIGAKLILRFMRTPADKTPITKYSLLAGTYLFAMYCSNWAIQFVSFPTMVLAKSCKPIPVMIMGFFVLNKRPTLLKSICVFLIVVGISIFMLDEKAGGKHGKGTVDDSSFGLILLGISLALDGLTGPIQERLIAQHSPSPKHMMYYTNLLASFALLIILIVTGQGIAGVQFCLEFPSLIPQILMYSITSAVGQNFIYLTIYQFGSLVCSLTTTTRKFFSILISVIGFGNSLTQYQWLGVLVVFVGLGVDIYGSARKKIGLKKD